MSENLKGIHVAILSTDGFEQPELTEPKKALEKGRRDRACDRAEGGHGAGLQHVDKGDTVKVDKTFEQARPEDYDGVVLPGGVVNGDALRMVEPARAFIKAVEARRKPIAVICHGTWLLVSTGIVKGRHGDELALAAGRYPQRGRHLGRPRGRTTTAI
ncbi:MAG: DJ-1/PfpI family protein [Pararobbsia sp.]